MSIQHVGAVLDNRDERLTGTRKLVLITLANRSDAMGACWPSQGLIAAECGIKERAVRDHLKALEADGFVSRQTKHRGQGKGSRTTYRLNLNGLGFAPAKSAGTNLGEENDFAPADSVTCTGSRVPITNLQEPTLELSNDNSLARAREKNSEPDSVVETDLAVQDDDFQVELFPPEKPKPKPAKQAHLPVKAKKAKKKPTTYRMPEDWCPSSETMAKLLKRGFYLTDLLREIEKCRLNFVDKPNVKRPGWENTFVKWMTSDFCKARPGTQMGRPSDPIQKCMAHVSHPARTGSEFLDGVGAALNVLDGTGTDGGTHAPMSDVLAFYEATVADGQLSWTIRDDPDPTQIAADIARNAIDGEDAFDRVGRKLSRRRRTGVDDFLDGIEEGAAAARAHAMSVNSNDFVGGAYEAAAIIDGEVIAQDTNSAPETETVSTQRKEPKVGDVDEHGLTYLGSSNSDQRENPFL